MSNEKGLAAVHAAADSISRADHEKALATATSEAHASGQAEGVKQGRADGLAEGAKAERARILGIEAKALPGHEALIAEMKADGVTTPDQAAGRIVDAEKATRAKRAQGVVDAGSTAKVAAAPLGDQTGKEGDKASVAATPEAWKAEFDKSDALKAEFVSADSYVAFKKAEADGKVKFLRQKA